MRKILLPLLFVGGTAFAGPSNNDAGINHPDAATEEIDKSIVTRSFVEGSVLKEFNKTALRTRIVKIKIKRGKKTKVYLTWHPRTAKDISKDAFIIMGVITKVIPRFHTITLKAIDPTYMRWSGHVFWKGIITRGAIHVNHFTDREPQPLFQ